MYNVKGCAVTAVAQAECFAVRDGLTGHKVLQSKREHAYVSAAKLKSSRPTLELLNSTMCSARPRVPRSSRTSMAFHGAGKANLMHGHMYSKSGYAP